ncbi:hypothetical protein ACPPVU_18600 [Mucilaginibacter sp. McL0603]|uniref:hypothetical protein n=1 Tax=Mucilaginibacter sp. McL0603 TaxID=3415670 RepID=UPI003CF1E853
MAILAATDMPFKKILLFILSIFFIVNCFAQETIEKKNRLNDNVTEQFTVLKSNELIKNGPYEAFYKRKMPIAMGNYTQNKKTGLWRFYNPQGKLMQMYNYDRDSLKYEAPEYKNSSDFWYFIDKDVADTDKVTKPVKAGGRYYGYLPYLGLYQIPFSPYQYSTTGCVAVIELLISPLGRLAAYKVRTVCDPYDFDQTINMDVKLFKEEDKQFIPATYNGEPVVSRIVIRCKVTQSGGLDFLGGNQDRQMQNAE